MQRLLCLAILLASGALAGVASEPEKPEFGQRDPRHWVVMVTQPGCSFCVRLESEILQPLRASGEFQDQVRFTTIDIGAPAPLTDFDGSQTTTTTFANRYKGFGTPTLLFLDSTGRVLSPAKFGVPDVVDFYAYEIEKTIRGLPRLR